MNTVLLQYAVEVEKTGSITQAANNLSMDQPNLSKAIKTLEESLGAPVFYRTPKGVVPTDKGRVFLRYARSVLDQLDEMEALYKPSFQTIAGLKLAARGFYHTGEAFRRFLGRPDRDQGADIRLWEREPASLLELLENGACPIGVLNIPEAHEKYVERLLEERGLAFTKLWAYTEILLLSRRHPLAGKRQASLEELRGCREIGGGEPLKIEEEGAKSRQRVSAEYICAEGTADRLRLLLDGENSYMWSPPVPEEETARSGLTQLACPLPEHESCDILVYRRGYTLNRLERAYIDELRQVCGELDSPSYR